MRLSAWTFVAAATAAYVVTLVLLSPLPLQDLPTHLSRAVVMDDLIFHGGTRFGTAYEYHFLVIPYVLGDLMLTGAVELFGLKAASAIWVALVLVSLPAALGFYMRVIGVTPPRQALVLLLALYLSTDWPFVMGFLSFRLGIAMTIATLALVVMLRARWSTAVYLTYVLAVLLDYLMHLSAAVFVTATVGGTAVVRVLTRTTRLRTELLFAAPLAAVLAWNFLVADSYRLPGDLVENPYIWGSVTDKLARMGSDFYRYRWHSETALILLLLLALVLQTSRPGIKQIRNVRLLELLTLAVTFLGLYIALPYAYSDAVYVDVRALPMVTIFGILTWVSWADQGQPIAPNRFALATGAALVLVAANLFSIATDLARQDRYVAQYRKMVAALPPHSRVLPIYTCPDYGRIKPYLHVNSFITLDRAGVMPYEFAGDNGNTVRYFRYRHRPYDPHEQWYIATHSLKLKWKNVSRDYDYLLITEPAPPGHLPVPATVVASNGAAEVLAIEK
jgi:hypothetical protein